MEASSDEFVRERRGNILLLRINRPATRNALNSVVMAGIGTAIKEAEVDPEIRAVVLIGTGDRAFCSGEDLREFADGTQGTVHPEAMDGFYRLIHGQVAVPVVGAANATAAAGMETTLEFGPGPSVPDLPTALAAVRAVGRPDFRLLIDTMHFVRSGSSVDDLAKLDPDLIGYVQLSDVPLVATIPRYMDEAMFERMVPGTGELPLLEILAALPRDLVIGLEIPLRSAAEAGVGPEVRLSRCVDAARRLLAQLDDEPN